MKRWAIPSILSLCLLLAAVSACSSGSPAATTQQLVKVVKGDITVTVTGDGNIEASRETRLTFGSGGKVDKIYVKEGDEVKEGDVLARLETSALELAKAQDQVALTQAKVALTQANLSQKSAERDLQNTLDTEDSLKLALLNAQIDVMSAEYNVEQTRDLYTWSDVKIAQADVNDAEEYLKYAVGKLGEYALLTEDGDYLAPEEGSTKAEGYKLWQKAVVQAQKRLDTARATLNAMLSGNDLDEVAIDKLQLEAARMAEVQARKNLDKLNQDVTIKQLEVEKAKESLDQAQESVDLARQSLDQAQKDLEEATITAPFDGVVATVGAKEGGTVPSPATSPQTVVYLIDPGSMDLMVEVDEIDVPDVRLGQEAIIDIDALPDASFSGRVTAIFPVPTTESGVVLYNVKIEMDANETSGARIGMTTSADIVINKHSNVLLVPERAIATNAQGEPYVMVMADGQIQQRPVVTGLSDGLQVEIINGLDEGETVVMEVKASSSSSGLGLF